MAILNKLLLIKIVASKVRGDSNKVKSRLVFGTLSRSLFNFSKSFGESEKKATSELETKAEATNNNKINKLAKAMLRLEISSKKNGSKFKANSGKSGSAPNIFLVVIW